jgi:PAS domain S-box-containing protein
MADNWEVDFRFAGWKRRQPKGDGPPELEALGIPFVKSPDPMWVYDVLTLRFLAVNDAAVRAYGYSRREFITMTLIDIRPTEDIKPFLHDWKHPHESSAEKWRHVGKDGRAFPVIITSWELTFQGRKAELILAKRDVPATTCVAESEQPTMNPPQQKSKSATTTA